MKPSDELLNSVLVSDDVFGNILYRIIRQDLGMTAAEFAEEAEIPVSSLYKIRSGVRCPNIRNLRQIIATVRKHENDSEEHIAVIAARMVLETITETKRKFGDHLITIKEYPASSIEDAIIAAVHAERDGARALVCAPIVSRTVEKIVSIPVTTIFPKESMNQAIEMAVKKSYPNYK